MLKVLGFGLIWGVGVLFMPLIIQNVFPGLPIALNSQPEPFYWAATSPRNPGGVLLQYYSPPLQHQVISGDTAFLIPADEHPQAYSGPDDQLERDARAVSLIETLDLQDLGNGWHRLHVELDDLGPSGLTFLYRETESGIQPVWAKEDGFLGVLPTLGLNAWTLMAAIWLVICILGAWLLPRLIG